MIRFSKRPVPEGELPELKPAWFRDLLLSRGIRSKEEAELFLHGAMADLRDPLELRGMADAVELIRDAVSAGTPIAVYGDYDVDGMCATSIMLETLRGMNADVRFYIPGRDEGYGMHPEAIRRLRGEGVGLLVTVDCGVTNCEEVALARALGMRVIVTDHHQPGDELPRADVLIDPHLPDSGAVFRDLCGAGLALKLAQALTGNAVLERSVDLAAMATVADVVPLLGENRIIVREGLKRMTADGRPGLAALIEVSGTRPPVTSEHIAFQLAPRLNAIGRLEKASAGVQLLTAPDRAAADPLAQMLNDNNRRRQAIQQAMQLQAEALMAESMDFFSDRVIIVHAEGWERGVIGLVAGKLCEKYHYPVIALSDGEGQSVGSCRSIEGVHIHRMLLACEHLWAERHDGDRLFERFGGHAAAAGLTIATVRLGELKALLNEVITRDCDPECFVPEQEYDCDLPLGEATQETVSLLEQLQPTGAGNPPPVFRTSGVSVQESRAVGRDGNTLQMTLEQDGIVKRSVGFGMGQIAAAGLECADLLYVPSLNDYMGRISVQLMLKAVTPVSRGRCPCRQNEFFLALLQDLKQLAANNYQINAEAESLPDILTEAQARELLRRGQGTLFLAEEPRRALDFLSEDSADLNAHAVEDGRGFTTVLFAPELERLKDIWRDIVLLDGFALPGEAALLREKCPKARLHLLEGVNPAQTALLKSLALDRDQLSRLYLAVRSGRSSGCAALAEAAQLTREQVLTGLEVFSELGLADFLADPFRLQLLPAPKKKLDLEASGLLRYVRNAAAGLPAQP